MVKVVKIFFASSYTFKEFRLSLEQRFKEKEVELEKRGINVRFEVIIWENRSETMQLDGSQNKYNYHIEQSDFFVLMASKRIGEYTYEEFKVAERTFENIALPKILILLDEDTTDEEDSLKEFKEELSSKKHYYSTFKDFDELWQKIDKELNFRIEKIFKKVASGEKAKEKFGEIVGDFYTDILIGRERVLAKIYKYS